MLTCLAKHDYFLDSTTRDPQASPEAYLAFEAKACRFFAQVIGLCLPRERLKGKGYFLNVTTCKHVCVV